MTTPICAWFGASLGYAIGHALLDHGWQAAVWTATATLGFIVMLGAVDEAQR